MNLNFSLFLLPGMLSLILVTYGADVAHNAEAKAFLGSDASGNIVIQPSQNASVILTGVDILDSIRALNQLVADVAVESQSLEKTFSSLSTIISSQQSMLNNTQTINDKPKLLSIKEEVVPLLLLLPCHQQLITKTWDSVMA